jgi:putative two-component system response regulator
MRNDESDSRPIILVVDDEPDFLDAVRLFLLSFGDEDYDIVTSSRPSLVAKIIERHASSIRMILLDIHMPEFSGLEILRWVRVQPGLENVPILMLSGDKAGRRRVAEADDPNIDFLLKPFDPEVLYYRVKRYGDFCKVTA